MAGSVDEGVALAGTDIVRRSAAGDEVLVPLSAVRLIGRHLVSDVLAAAASIIGRWPQPP